MENLKLMLIPSGYRSGNVYSILPTDGVGDFDFSRNAPATRVNKDGLIETVNNDVPRLDWLNSDCPSLLLEPQRTNEFSYSEDFTNSYWYKQDCSITSNQIFSPDGNLTADLMTATSNNGTFFSFNQWTTTTKTASFYLKKNTSTLIRIINSSTGENITFNLDSGVVQSASTGFEGDIISLNNGWYRVNTQYQVSSGTSGLGLRIPISGESVYVWGAQIETATYLTSYIKSPSVGTVTRQKDICINGGDSDLFNITEGTLFLDVTPYIYPSANTYISLNDGGSSDRFVFIFQSYGTEVRLFGVSSGVNFLSNYQTITFNQKNKLAITFKQNEFKIYVNGVLRYTDTSGNVPTGLNQLDFTEHNGNRNFQGKVHDTRVYDRVLTQAEAIELTTL